MASKLKKLRIEEVSLVDRPANQHALALLFKRDGSGDAGTGDAGSDTRTADDHSVATHSGDGTMADKGKDKQDGGEPTVADLEKKLADADAARVAAEKRATEAEASVGDLTKRLEALEKGDKGDKGEDIFKGMSPEARARFEKMEQDARAAQERIAKMEADRAHDALTTRLAKAAGSAPVKAAELATVVAKLDEAGVAAIENVLKQFSGAMKDAALLKSLGQDAQDGDPETDPMAFLKSEAARIQKANPKLSSDEAFAQACDENPDAYLAASGR